METLLPDLVSHEGLIGGPVVLRLGSRKVTKENQDIQV